METPNWENTLDCSKKLTFINECRNIAHKLGYQYFVNWSQSNGKVYEVLDISLEVTHKTTEFTYKDIV